MLTLDEKIELAGYRMVYPSATAEEALNKIIQAEQKIEEEIKRGDRPSMVFYSRIKTWTKFMDLLDRE